MISPGKFFLVGLVAIVIVSLGLVLLGMVFSGIMALAGFLLFKVLPIAFVGYLLYHFIAPKKKKRGTVEGD